MAQQLIGIGSAPNDGTGDTLRVALDKANDNFTEIYEARFAAGVTLASAGTTDIGAQTSIYVTISGTTTITSLGTAAAGVVRFVRFSGALTLTHNGTSLILPGAANIVTVAGDTATFISEGSGNWRAFNYLRSAYSPPGGAWLTWTPTIAATVAAGSGFTYTIEQADYEKIGRTVRYQARVLITNLGSGPAGSGNLTMTLPAQSAHHASVHGFEGTAVGNIMWGRVDSGTSLATYRFYAGAVTIGLNYRYWLDGCYQASS